MKLYSAAIRGGFVSQIRYNHNHQQQHQICCTTPQESVKNILLTIIIIKPGYDDDDNNNNNNSMHFCPDMVVFFEASTASQITNDNTKPYDKLISEDLHLIFDTNYSAHNGVEPTLCR